MQVSWTSKCYDRWDFEIRGIYKLGKQKKCVFSYFIISWVTAKGHSFNVLFIKPKLFICKIHASEKRRTIRAETSPIGRFHPERYYRK